MQSPPNTKTLESFVVALFILPLREKLPPGTLADNDGT